MNYNLNINEIFIIKKSTTNFRDLDYIGDIIKILPYCIFLYGFYQVFKYFDINKPYSPILLLGYYLLALFVYKFSFMKINNYEIEQENNSLKLVSPPILTFGNNVNPIISYIRLNDLKE